MTEILYKNSELGTEIKDVISHYIKEAGISFEKINVEKKNIKGYKVEIKNNEINIYYKNLSHLGRGIFTLGNGKNCCEIEDKCIFNNFTIMVDMARNSVMNLSSLKELINNMFLMGYTSLGLYLEDILKINGQPYFGYMRGAYSNDEIKEIVRYGNEFGIEIVPYIQTLAHLNQITRYEQYQKFIDCDDILLVDDNRTYEFLDKYIEEVSKIFTTKRINIGMDEAHMVGLGKFLNKHGFEERTRIIQRHLKKVIEITKKYNLEPEMWSDMFFRLVFNGEYDGDISVLVDKFNIPKDVKLVYWDYYSTDEEHYDKNIKKHLVLTKNFAMASGAWSWSGFVPHNNYSFCVMENSQLAMKKNKCKDYIVTMWGDDGGECSIFSLLPALFYCSNLAYSNKANNELFKVLTGYAIEEMLEIDKLNPIQKKDTHNNLSKIWLYDNIIINTFGNTENSSYREYYKELSLKLDNLSQRESKYNYLFKTYGALGKILELKVNIGNRIRAIYESKEPLEKKEKELSLIIKDLEEIVKRLEIFIYNYKNQWYKENKLFGYEVQSVRLNGLVGTIKDAIELLICYKNGSVKTIDYLEEELLPFKYFDNYKLESLTYNIWKEIASVSKF